MAVVVRVEGLLRPGSASTTRGGPPTAKRHEFGIRPVAEYDLGATRATPEAAPVQPLPPNTVVELSFEDGFRLFTRPEGLERDFAMPVRRDGANEEIRIPRQLQTRRPSAAQRGLVGWALRKLSLFDTAAELAAAGLATAYEDAIARRHGDREKADDVLCRLALDGSRAPRPLLPNEDLGEGQGPLLVFVHGTASSTRGSFGGLWSEIDGGLRQRLREQYGNRVYGFEHRSLTESPVRNALELARRLPAGACVHLVTHSRGGLVGELLCRGERIADANGGAAAFGDDEIAQYTKRLREATSKSDADDELIRAHAQDLRELAKVLSTRQLRIERFVRVACPMRGTTLASERFDYFLSALANIFDSLPGVFGEAAALFADFARALVAQKADPRVLPGLEAMMPDSALVWLLNQRHVQVSSDLAVIAGDIEGAGVLGRLGVFLTDVFFRGQHDLVVDTAFMVGGARRARGAWRYFCQGPKVSHFGYFAEAPSSGALIEALVRPMARPKDFEALDVGEQALRGGASLGGAGDAPARKSVAVDKLQPGRPAVFVLPGILGSHLKVGDERIWLKLGALVGGGMERITIGADGVSPDALIDDFYGRLAAHLADTHQVVEWPYDWRLPIAESARRLARDVETALDRIGPAMPLMFIAHSMGGLVVRSLELEAPAVWEKVTARPQWRFVMLGTPNRGSFSVPAILLGRDDTVGQIATVDLRHSLKDLLQIVSRFSGLYDMMPRPEGGVDLFDPATWRVLRDRENDNLMGRVLWPLPDENELVRARAYAKRLDDQFSRWQDRDKSPGLDGHVIYVAGRAALTPESISARGPIELFGGARGDGRVTWASAIPQGLRTYYLDASHGDLPAQEACFGGFVDLLLAGATQRLRDEAPAERGGTAVSAPMPREFGVPESDADLEAAAMGSSKSRARDALSGQVPRLREITVKHADLRYADDVLMIGHYRGDALLSAEREVNERMHNALRRALDLRLYPGELNTSRCFVTVRDPASGRGGGSSPAGDLKLEGAVIVGLGKPGDLTTATLRETVLHAALSYAMRRLELDAEAGGRAVAAGAPPTTLVLSSLLIGTSASMLSIEDSVVSIARAVQDANERLHAQDINVSFDRLEFVELWQDRAIEAVRMLQSARRAGRLPEGANVEPLLIESSGGRIRSRFAEDSAWWHRLRIAANAPGADVAGRGFGGLRFTLQTDRARLESRLLPTQRRQIDKFVAEAVGQVDNDGDTAEALYQLLLPNELKSEALLGRRLVLMVDEHSAGYPWEMLKADGPVEKSAPALAGGVVRQLDLESFRERSDVITDRSALVIADPLIGEGQLPGARREGEHVARTLGQRGFSVLPLLGSTGPEAIRTLMGGRFQILHLAGHGQYRTNNVDGDAITGMLLGDEWYLTANEINQMPGIPELVFVNCCHLGSSDSTVGRLPSPRGEGAPEAPAQPADAALARPHIFAASLATQLMKIGVRCVVAAGWAIDDDAALVFSERFYEEFLGGRTFGEAVREARLACFMSQPGSNTWAAYQCYGDPDFRLTRPATARAGAPRVPSFVAAAEVVTELDNLAANVGQIDASVLVDRIAQVESAIPPAWRNRGDVLAALGNAYRAADDLDGAISCYEKALSANDGRPALLTIERLANLLPRRAIEQFLAERPTIDKTSALAQRDWKERQRGLRKEVERGVCMLRSLCDLAATPERLTLLASVCKRQFLIEDDPAERAECLRSMGDHAFKALKLLRERSDAVGAGPAGEGARMYANLFRLAAEIGLAGNDLVMRNELAGWAAKELAASRELKDRRTVWDHLFESDFEILRALAQSRWTLDDTKGRDRDTLLADRHRILAERGASAVERRSASEQIAFFDALLGFVPPEAPPATDEPVHEAAVSAPREPLPLKQTLVVNTPVGSSSRPPKVHRAANGDAVPPRHKPARARRTPKAKPA